MEETTLSRRLLRNKFQYKLFRLNKIQLAEALTYFFVLLFTYTGLRKLIDLSMYVREIWGFAIFGSKLAVKLELLALSVAELCVALLLAFPRTKLLGWYVTFLLIITININMFIMQQYAKIIPLYYGGIFPKISFLQHFVINLILLFIALKGVLLQIKIKEKRNHNSIN